MESTGFVDGWCVLSKYPRVGMSSSAIFDGDDNVCSFLSVFLERVDCSNFEEGLFVDCDSSSI